MALRTLRHIGVFLFTSLLFCACASSPPDRALGSLNWPMYQLQPDHNAVISAASLPTWSYAADAKINGGMALVAGQLILDTFGGKIISLDVRTGRPIWIADADNVVMSTPVVQDNVVVVGTGMNGALGEPNASFVYDAGLNRADEIWGRAEGDHILAFDLRSGARLWSYRTAGEDMPSAAIAGGILAFANGDQHAYGLDLRTGDDRWRSDLSGVSTMASANAADGLIYVSACNLSAGTDETRAIDAATGTLRWRVPFGNCDAAPTLGTNRLFLSDATASQRGKHHFGRGFVTAVDPRTGHLLWRYVDRHAGAFTTKGSSERAIAGTYAQGRYYQSIPTSESLVALDARSGKVVWRLQTRAPIKMSPVISGGRLYAGDADGTLYTVDSSSGRLISTRRFDEGFTTAPLIIVGKSAILATTTHVRTVGL